jgi:ribonucleoside-diphosphate reductase alpha chain
VIQNKDLLATPIARHIWASRYRRNGLKGQPEKDIRASWRRVANALAAVEGKNAAYWRNRFLEALDDFRFMPAGRILAGAGTGRRVTLFNCFVMGPIEDDLESIFEALKEGALTMQAGGGIGYDFSTLRPAGSLARSTGRIASGPVPFLEVWDAMCATVLSTGARRGAMLASLRCDHPDIEAFIKAKREPGRLQRFNLSVQVSDAFMQAVADDADWPLLFPEPALQPAAGGQSQTLAWPGYPQPVPCRVVAQRPARELWRALMRSCYETGEPGVLFVDTINRLNNLAYRETLATCNPCGEAPLPPYGACNLGSFNLTRFVRDPFTGQAAFDLDVLRELVPVAVRLLDNVIDCSQFPLPAQATEAQGARRIGLGITGLADALIMLGLRYDSGDGRAQAAAVMQAICEAAYRASIELAWEKGPFPFYQRDDYQRSRFLQTLPADIREGVARHGIRNSHLTAIAPTGTISLLAGNVSSGIEPVFDDRLNRGVRGISGEPEWFETEDYACRLWRQNEATCHDELPPAFVRAHDLPPAAQLRMQAALQRFVDGAISKTVNVPEDFSPEAFGDIYRQAHELGLKGCTAFRPNPARAGVLESREAEQTPGRMPDIHCCMPEREGE